MIQKVIQFFKTHKFITFVVILILAGGGYYEYKKITTPPAVTTYTLATVEKGTIIKTVSGTGQVSSSNQMDIKPKVSGDIIAVRAIAGQQVKTGAFLVQLDATDALKAVRDAKASLESAKLSLAKLQEPTDQLSLTQAENTLIQAKVSLQNSQSDLTKAYDDGFTAVANAFLNLPSMMTGLYNILYSTDINRSQANKDFYVDAVSANDSAIVQYANSADSSYQKAKTDYDKNLNDYKSLNRYSSTDQIESLIYETYNTVKEVSDAIKNSNNFIQYYQSNITNRGLIVATTSNTHLTNLSTYTGQANSNISSLLLIKQTIQSDKDTIDSSNRTIVEKTQSLDKLKAGTDPLDLQSAQLTVTQKENSLLDAQQTLGDYSIRAPFDGTVAAVNVKRGDPASSGTAVVTLISPQQIAEISLNEVDVAKIKVGQKVNMTFDAIDGLNMTGKVAQIDTIGTVAQGVVNYTVKIAFDTEDSQIKPGMSVNSSIITDVKQDVLMAPNSSVKTQGTNHYVEILDQTSPAPNSASDVISPNQPTRKSVEIGIADDSNTEITSGLNEGDKIISKTNSPTAAKTTNTAPSLFGGGGGNAARALGR